jgi:hypothetical protein
LLEARSKDCPLPVLNERDFSLSVSNPLRRRLLSNFPKEEVRKQAVKIDHEIQDQTKQVKEIETNLVELNQISAQLA